MEIAVFKLAENQDSAFGSNRYAAIPVRQKLQNFLAEHDSVVLDFEYIEHATQSWVDALIGRFVYEQGQTFLSKVQFKNCSADIQEIIRFVAADRLRDHKQQQAKPNLVGNTGLSYQ